MLVQQAELVHQRVQHLGLTGKFFGGARRLFGVRGGHLRRLVQLVHGPVDLRHATRLLRRRGGYGLDDRSDPLHATRDFVEAGRRFAVECVAAFGTSQRLLDEHGGLSLIHI